jgi:hypothetical protein
MGTAGRSAPLRRAGSLLGLLGLELGAVLALHWLGRFPGLRIRWDQPVPWVLSSPVQDVLGAVLRTVGLVMAYWLLASTVLYLLASLTRLPSAVRAVGWATLPLARRVADHAVAVTLATSMVGGTTLGVAGPALAADRGGGMGPSARKPVAAAQATGSSGQQDPPSSATETTEPPAGRYVPDPADQVPTSGSETTAPPSTAPETTEPPASRYVPEPADQAPRRLPASGQPATTKAPKTTAAPTTTKAPTTTAAPTTTEAPAAAQAPTTTEAPASNAPTTTQGGAPPTTVATPAPPATRKGTAAPTTTHAYEFNPATTSTSRAAQEPPGGDNQGGGQGPGNEPGKEPGGGGNTRSDERQPYQVASGDNLWAIARAHLSKARSGGSGEPTNREVADYWVRVVEANLHGLRSGNPDLIYPGEEITLPPVD